MEASSRNENRVVDAATGARMVLRRCRRNAQLERIRWQCELQQRLVASGFPTPDLLLANDGAATVEISGLPWTLQVFVAGEHVDFERANQLAEAGRRLAEFHAVAADSERTAVHPLEVDYRHYWVEPDAELAARRHRFEPHDLATEVDALERWPQRLQQECPLGQFDALPRGVAHLYYHGRNLLFDGARMSALLDFDMAEHSPFVLDIADALICFGRERRGSLVIRVDAARTFLEAYERERALTPDERGAIPAIAPLIGAPLDRRYPLFNKRYGEDPVASVRRGLERWRTIVGLRPGLERVVARG
ncbi:MAG: phosphotransferase [Chloroflexi bacterium]|nr:phosphotransferase [Chloroflexota bacterium]